MRKSQRGFCDILEKDNALTPFQKRVYRAVMSIPKGETRSYRWVAEKIRNPKSFRAVGQALKRNPYLGFVPCHRVIKADGSLGGFSVGKKKKITLLRREGLDLPRQIKYN